MNGSITRKRRCAIYTRKSSEEGLEQEFNSLDAQREACAAYIVSQKAEGWVEVETRFDDGGISGATLERPGLKRLLAEIEAGNIDIVVVYKIDRLSRSLMDFARLVEVFDRRETTFISVTQSFNTTTSMGRLTLNILLSFAQFEREVIGERIRDKFAASRRKGLWMGGYPPFGYRVQDRKLEIVPDEAKIVRRIYARYLELGSTTRLARELRTEGVTTRSGKPLLKVALHRLLRNRVYIGEAVHKGQAYPGQHQGLISKDLWEKAQSIHASDPHSRSRTTSAKAPALLRGLLFAPNDRPMVPTQTRRKGYLYRYYCSIDVIKIGPEACPIRRLAAGEVEGAVISQLRRILVQPEIVVQTWKAARERGLAIDEAEVKAALLEFDKVWDELFPLEQSRIIQLLVARVDAGLDGLKIHLRTEGLIGLLGDLLPEPADQRVA